MAEQETSPGGSRIHRYEPDTSGISPPSVSGLYYTEIEARYEKMLGAQGEVFHELVSDQVHIDVLTFPPNAQRDDWTFATIGMSDKPMTVPEGLSEPQFYQRAEMLISLPPDWLDAKNPDITTAFKDENIYWPIYWLKTLARFPHEYNTWLWYGHSIPNGDPAQPLAQDLPFIGFAIGPVSTWPKGANIIDIDTGLVAILGLYPVYDDEMQLKLNKGTDVLFDAFEQNGITQKFDPQRKSVAG